MRSALGLAGLWPGRRLTSLACRRELMAPTAPPSRCALTHLNEKAPTSGALHEVGGTGLEPVTPSLSTRRTRSHPFGPVRPECVVEPDAGVEPTVARTRTNDDPCHPCHAPGQPHRHSPSSPLVVRAALRSVCFKRARCRSLAGGRPTSLARGRGGSWTPRPPRGATSPARGRACRTRLGGRAR